MIEWGRRGLFSGGMVVAALVVAAADPSAAKDAFTPVLAANGPIFCGPCEPSPVVTRAAPESPVVVHRYRWAPEARSFQLVGGGEVGTTDHQGELRFTVPNAKDSLDKIVVSVGDLRSSGMIFLTNGGCGGPLLCPMPRPIHAVTNASAYLSGQAVFVTVTGAQPGTILDIVQEEYVVDGDVAQWIPTREPFAAEVDPLGRATVIQEAAWPGVYRAIARDRATGAESSFALYEVAEGVRVEKEWFKPVW